MPRDKSAVMEPPPANALVASAVRMPKKVSRIYHTTENWQRRAWEHYDQCGELRYAVNWIANVLTRATLHVARRTETGPERVLSGRVVSDFESLFDGPNGQAQMLHSLATHLTVAGEAYLVGREDSALSTETIWEIVGTEEMRKIGDAWQIVMDDQSQPIDLTDNDVIIRIWRSHPRKRILADSPVRAVLPVLEELHGLNRHINAQVTSRLTGGGLLVLPTGLSFPKKDGVNAGAGEAGSFMEVLGEAMLRPIEDPDSPSAVVPVIVTVPPEAVDKVNLIKFWSPLDEHAIDLRTEAIRRLALGMDMPSEVLLGTSDMNHWGAWQMEESSIKAHIEPLLELIVNALTVGYLRPLSEKPDPNEVVAYDTTMLRLRPNRSKEAVELYDRAELNGDALRRETGFDADDAMAPDQFKAWLLKKVAGGSSTPEQVAEALRVLTGVMFPAGDVGRQERPDPSLLEHPVLDIPEQAASLQAAAEMVVFRALERAGNRLKTRSRARPPGVPSGDLYRYVPASSEDLDVLLDDAWRHVPAMCEGTGVECEKVTAALDAYCRSLLLSREPHDRASMVRYLNLAAS